eukprot:gene4488-4918_t
MLTRRSDGFGSSSPMVDSQDGAFTVKPDLLISINSLSNDSVESAHAVDLEQLEFSTTKVLNFDRYTKMATRIFKVAQAGVALVDNRRSWLRSRFSMMMDMQEPFSQQSPLMFFVYSMIQQQSSEIMIVQDTLNDPRFSAHPCVVGPPHIRFFAAATLIVNKVKIGALCLIDREPRKSFGLKSISMLLDLAGIITGVIVQKQENVLSTEDDIARINMSVLYNLRCPIQTSLSRYDDLVAAYHDLLSALDHQQRVGGSEEVLYYQESFKESLNEFSRSTLFVQEVLEVCLNLAHKYLAATTYTTRQLAGNRTLLRAELCDIIQHTSMLRASIERDLTLSCDVIWAIDVPSLNDSFVTYPDVIKLVILTTLSHISGHWKEVTIQVSYLLADACRNMLGIANRAMSKDNAPRRRASYSAPSNSNTSGTPSASSNNITANDGGPVGYLAISFQCAHRKTQHRHSIRMSGLLAGLCSPIQSHPGSQSGTPPSSAGPFYSYGYSSTFDDVVLRNLIALVDGILRMKAVGPVVSPLAKQFENLGMVAVSENTPPVAQTRKSMTKMSQTPIKERYDCYIPCLPKGNQTRSNSLLLPSTVSEKLSEEKVVSFSNDVTSVHTPAMDAFPSSLEEEYLMDAPIAATLHLKRSNASRANSVEIGAIVGGDRSEEIERRGSSGSTGVIESAVNMVRAIFDTNKGAKIMPR